MQKQWKQVGVTDRKVDQKLWKKFRRVCDAVFNRKNEQRNSERELEEKNLRTFCRKLMAADAVIPFAAGIGSRSIRDSRYMYAEYPGGATQLFDLINDPGELENLAGNAKHAEEETRMRRLLHQKMQILHPIRMLR